MSTLVPYESRYLGNLHEMVTAEITRQYELLATSTLITVDPGAVGMRTARVVGTIEGLKSALAYMKNVHEDMTGKVKRKREED